MSFSGFWGPVIVAVLLIVATWLGCAAQISALNQRANNDAISRATQLASSYEGDGSSTINLVDNMLRFLGAYDLKNGVRATAALIAQEHLYRGLSGNIAVIDATGHGFAVGAKGSSPISIGDRAYVKAAVHSGSLIIGTPLVARVTKQYSIPFARAVRRPDGTVIGTITSVINVTAFSYGYTPSDFGPHGVMDFIGARDGIVRSRVSASRSQALVGREVTRNFPVLAGTGQGPAGLLLADHLARRRPSRLRLSQDRRLSDRCRGRSRLRRYPRRKPRASRASRTPPRAARRSSSSSC